MAYQVDAFTTGLFGGNPAVVVFLDNQLPDNTLKLIARENAVPETAFLLKEDGSFTLRWFTPDIEMDLCGHATLAAAHVLFEEGLVDGDEILFKTASGEIFVTNNSGNYSLSFPIREGVQATLPKEIYDSLSIKPTEVYRARDFMLIYDKESDIENLKIDRDHFDRVNLGTGGVIVTAPGDEVNFVSRFFTPQSTIFEDPVTGSAHCTLAPYWGRVLKLKTMRARQLSERGGELICRLFDDKVVIIGNAITYSKSEILL